MTLICQDKSLNERNKLICNFHSCVAYAILITRYPVKNPWWVFFQAGQWSVLGRSICYTSMVNLLGFPKKLRLRRIVKKWRRLTFDEFCWKRKFRFGLIKWYRVRPSTYGMCHCLCINNGPSFTNMTRSPCCPCRALSTISGISSGFWLWLFAPVRISSGFFMVHGPDFSVAVNRVKIYWTYRIAFNKQCTT